jgi:hypothetical protein
MSYNKFVANVISKDSRNWFAKYEGELDNVPDEFKSFYSECNPIDVEITSDRGGVRFCAADELATLQAEYSYINARFIFATTNGDPVFFQEGKIYTCPHGAKEPQWELLANSFADYIVQLLS